MTNFNFVKQYAEQVGGQFTSYDSTKSILVIAVAGGRFQTILLSINKSLTSGKDRGLISSKICEYNSSINAKELLEQNSRFDYSNFVIDNGHLKVEAAFPLEGTSEDEVTFMIQEVAAIADSFELKLTGKDIH